MIIEYPSFTMLENSRLNFWIFTPEVVKTNAIDVLKMFDWRTMKHMDEIRASKKLKTNDLAFKTNLKFNDIIESVST